MSTTLQEAADTILGYTVGRAGGVPGVVAMATDTNSNFYEGTAGVRDLDKDQAMTSDTIKMHLRTLTVVVK